MKLDFRIDWGYQYLYSRRHYHPQFLWDGTLTCENGTIEECYQLEYPVLWWGPGHSAKETKLENPEWKSFTKRRLAGVRFVAEIEKNTVFHLRTLSADLDFTAEEILEKGRHEFPVGPKYLGCYVIVTKTDFLWYRPKPVEGETEFEISSLGLPLHNWARMKLAWLSPGETAQWEADIAESQADYCEQLLHLVAMAVPEYTDGKETQVRGDITLELFCDGAPLLRFTRFYRSHDKDMQMLEDDWQRFCVAPGHHTFALRNLETERSLGISRLKMRNCEFSHGQLSIPEWALKNEKMTGKVFAAFPASLTVTQGNTVIPVPCQKGWNEFGYCIAEPGIAEFACGKNTARTEIFDVEEEPNPIRVGYDMTVVPHDLNGQMDWLLDYTQRTRLGNYIQFRPHGPDPDPEWMYSWGEYCKNHGIYAAACRNYEDGALARGAGEMFHDCGQHEYPGKVYAFDPTEPYASEDMKQASEKYLAFLKEDIDKTHQVCDCAAYGDASGGIRYTFLAGVDFVRAETMVGHTMTLLSQARPAAEALGKGEWGVHIAIQHAYQPYHWNHLGQYFLSLFQPWIMGANTIYEEDSLFELFKEERQTWDDALTKGKRDMTRQFFKFVKTHPRKGKCERKIAFLEGRYAAPFSGFICDIEQDPHYSVWGLFGNHDPSWGHAQPEKCRQILDVLMPGASTQPFRQRFDRRRFFFSGTPYGDFDCVPVEAGNDYLQNYNLLLNLGWNTAIPEDWDKLFDYVKNGGTLLTGIPQFSTHVNRQFLKDMDDLALFRDGDLSELCGFKVVGKGVEYCGQWNCKDRINMPEPVLSAMPSDSSEEDGKALLAEIELCGAEVVAWDTFTGKPMLVRYSLGKGFVYTLTLWAYPGHEKFQQFSASWVAQLSEEKKSEVFVTDASGEVFWTIWQDGDTTRVFLLNTDWTTPGNEREVTLVFPQGQTTFSVAEGTLKVAEISDATVSVETWTL